MEVGNSNNNAYTTTSNGDSVSYTFNGTGIEYITETHPDHGEVDVYIDGALHKTVNAYGASQAAQVTLHSVQNLAAGMHTIELVKRSGNVMLLDAFKVL